VADASSAAAREESPAVSYGSSGSGSAGATEQPADTPSSYVPAPVSFVSPDEDEEFTAASAQVADPGDDRAGDGTPGAGSSAWKDSGRPGSGERVFDVSAGRRRPVVFEEDDDLDVPDFLK
jgi:cell division protein FtsZ